MGDGPELPTASELHVPGCTPTLAEGVPRPLSQAQVPGFLEPYGYACRDAAEWRQWDPLPQLTLRVASHTKVNGHTYYHVGGALARADCWHLPYLQWQVALRLSHLREGLHDPVKRELGRAGYGACFGGAPFAQRRALHGTTARLNLWCQRLAQAVNEKAAPPAVVAAVLRLLRAPELPEDSQPGEMSAPGDRNPFSAELPRTDRPEDVRPDPPESEAAGAGTTGDPEPRAPGPPEGGRVGAIHRPEDVRPDPPEGEAAGAGATGDPEPRAPGPPEGERVEAIPSLGSAGPPGEAACQEGSECSSDDVGDGALAELGGLSEESV